ncbi:MAG: glycoside hydrolase family 3 C-terminal domain-containing protein [Bacteroidales bacterium]|nr:glycoside hydrolase family 3 C-terminal domain-containing protein [Bacteroidales bacterium]MBQ7772400.1 glycoside hydrolase family 3 C-terminal domain-containing protein [Bacteroidales bacterium]MBQ8812559.1 glycoside hydrolase family 3 C-terminal domain-containing protein [Bacteroidales bacterium]
MSRLINNMLLSCIALAITACAVESKSETDKKVDDLLKQMTLHEKVGQMNQLSGGAWLVDQAAKGEVGSILNCVDPVEINAVQKAAVEESRLGIPILVSRDVIHGFRTIFPIPLGLAATFDPEIVERGARIAAVEATASGIRWTFSPMLDIARDPRWGRVAEGSGEDPYLDVQMGVAMVKGYQGNDLSDPTSMAACIKHFVGYGAAEGGRDYNSTMISERSLRNTYFPAFKAAAEAGAATLMTSFNEIDGIPSTGNKWLLKDVLRDEWGWDGMVVTDWNSAGEMIAHGFSRDLKHTTEQAVNAGVDMDMMSYGFIQYVEELVKEGKVSEKEIDRAVRNILKLKFELGLFENPYVDESASAKVDYAPEHLEAAKQTAIESAILLQNKGNVLPLDKARTILVTGPLADAPYEQMGTWAFDGQKEHSVTPLEALREEYDVIWEPGLKYSRDKNTASFAKVRNAAARADAAVVFVGEEAILSGEAHSLSNLNLQGAQSELIAEVAKAGKPVVAVVIAGRPLTIERDLANCDAMLYSFHPGTMGGPALADLIKGKAVPSGKTPITFLRDAGQAPFYYNHNNGGRPCNGTETLLEDIPIEAGQTSLGCTSYYLDTGYGPLFPFGYGLSYTAFEYGKPVLEKTEFGKEDVIRASVELKNTGNREAVETVQLYVQDLVGSVVRPVKELKRFDRVALAPGEVRNVTFELPVSELAFWNIDMEYAVEPGDFRLWIAGDSASGEPVGFAVID